MLRKFGLMLLVFAGLAAGVGSAIAIADSATTGTNVACATATLPAHTIADNGTGVYTISGTSTTACHTETYTIPTVTVTTSGTTPTPTPTDSCPAVPGASQTLGGTTFNREGYDTFTKAQPSGSSWSNGNDTTPVYTGDQGMGWTSYPDGWGANGVTPAYQPSTVVSVHDGMLDYHLQNDVAANLSPVPSSGRYQTYGAWSICEKVAPDASSPNGLGDFKQAILLWPQSDSNGPAAESDFPEGGLSGTSMQANAHYASTQDTFNTGTLDLSKWHVYTQTWEPGKRCYYVDGTQIGCSTSSVWSQSERFQLQVQPDPGHTGGGSHGHVYFGWAWVGGLNHAPTPPPPPPPPAGKISHVVVIMMENNDYAKIYGPQPYETSLADKFGLATNYYATGHYSLDNYLTATSGLVGVGNNDSCLSSSSDNIFHQLGAGNAIGYVESGGTACRHNPVEQYSDLGSSFETTLPTPPFSSTAFDYKYAFVTPNLCNDDHDCAPSSGDQWLSKEIPALQATPQYQAGSMAIFVVFDESNVNDTQGNTTPPDNHVYMAVVSPYTSAVKDSTQFTHCSLLATTEDIFGVPRLGCAAGAPSMLGKFGF